MNLHIKRICRAPAHGFTLLEAILAFAVLGMVLAATYSLSVQYMRQQIEAQQDYELTTMARALLDEYTLTYPMMPTSGTYKNAWEWQITEASQEGLASTNFDHHFRFVRITARVKKKETDGTPYELFTVIARRALGV